jgi:hypothetical protein
MAIARQQTLQKTEERIFALKIEHMKNINLTISKNKQVDE